LRAKTALLLAVAFLLMAAERCQAQGKHTLTTEGTQFYLNGQPFPYTGVSFFNAIYNSPFNQTSAQRVRWLDKFQEHGINVLRIWAQWDNARGFVDACADCTLYQQDGRLRADRMATLLNILRDADSRGMVVLLVLFSYESWGENIRLGEKESDAAVAAVARELKPYRNVALQIWNEFSWRTVEMTKIIKAEDPERLVTSSPGFAGVLTASREETDAMDFLTPHTSRQTAGKPWEIAPAEIRYLLKRYRKPVVDDEPARNGTASFGGPREPTHPTDHILQIAEVWRVGGYITYHHDMFQTGAGSPSVPPTGIPDPEFSPYHRRVFEFIALRQRYAPEMGR
jgi:hypothetical protein